MRYMEACRGWGAPRAPDARSLWERRDVRTRIEATDSAGCRVRRLTCETIAASTAEATIATTVTVATTVAGGAKATGTIGGWERLSAWCCVCQLLLFAQCGRLN